MASRVSVVVFMTRSTVIVAAVFRMVSAFFRAVIAPGGLLELVVLGDNPSLMAGRVFLAFHSKLDSLECSLSSGGVHRFVRMHELDEAEVVHDVAIV